MKIIFLDIDGVLNRIGTRNRTETRWQGYIGMEPELVMRFNQLCERTGAKVVLSSVWRKDDEWEKTMQANGLTCEFIGRTPSHDSGERGDEVDFWLCGFLAANPDEQVRYAILDDDPDFFPSQPLYHTNYEDGLTPEIAQKLEAYFNASYPLARSDKN